MQELVELAQRCYRERRYSEAVKAAEEVLAEGCSELPLELVVKAMLVLQKGRRDEALEIARSACHEVTSTELRKLLADNKLCVPRPGDLAAPLSITQAGAVVGRSDYASAAAPGFGYGWNAA